MEHEFVPDDAEFHLRTRLEPEPFTQRLGDDDLTPFANTSRFHTIKYEREVGARQCCRGKATLFDMMRSSVCDWQSFDKTLRMRRERHGPGAFTRPLSLAEARAQSDRTGSSDAFQQIVQIVPFLPDRSDTPQCICPCPLPPTACRKCDASSSRYSEVGSHLPRMTPASSPP